MTRHQIEERIQMDVNPLYCRVQAVRHDQPFTCTRRKHIKNGRRRPLVPFIIHPQQEHYPVTLNSVDRPAIN